jgi:hypothetical protein
VVASGVVLITSINKVAYDPLKDSRRSLSRLVAQRAADADGLRLTSVAQLVQKAKAEPGESPMRRRASAASQLAVELVGCAPA